MEGGNEYFGVDPRLIDRLRRKHKRRRYLAIPLYAVAVFWVIPLPPPLQANNPRALLAGSLAISAIATYGMLRDWRFAREINRVAITERGIYPPYKPKEKLQGGDWFLRYRDIVAMEPVVEKGGRVPAFDIVLKDGLRFQLNALDLLAYVGESEVRSYEKMLRVIREEVTKPENRTRASKGEDIIIPEEKFKGISA